MEEMVLCPVCYVYYHSRHLAGHEMSEVHHRHVIRQVGGGISTPIVEIQSAVKGRLKTFWVSGGGEHTDLVIFLNSKKNLLLEKVVSSLKDTALKINILVKAKFHNDKNEERVETQDRWFKTKNVRVFEADNVNEILETLFAKLLKEKSESSAKGSGWTLSEIIGLELRINRYKPLRGSSFIELPSKIKLTHSVINVKNEDDFCFKYAIWGKKVECHAERLSKYNNYEFFHGYNWNCIKYPADLSKISKFEQENSISINVFGLDEKNNVYPIKVVDRELEDHRDLLYLVEGGRSHYCWIKNFNRLISFQMSKHKRALHVCKRCFKPCYSSDSLKEHNKDCRQNSPTKIIVPNEEDSSLKFQNYSHTFRIPYVVYADFECILRKLSSCTPNEEHSYTNKQHQHDVMSFCMLMVSNTGEIFEPFLYRGKNAMEVFLEKLKEMTLFVRDVYKNIIPIDNLTENEINNFNSAQNCHICGKELGLDRVRDHDHLTGKFRGAAHNGCNVNFKVPNFLPVFIHNLSNYDAHLIVPHLGYDDMKISCIPNNEEKYISFAKNVDNSFSFRFIDSFRFLGTSLSKLVSSIQRDKFVRLAQAFGEKSGLVMRKGIFPYEYVDSWEKLDEISLPNLEQFYSTLTEDTISVDDYEFAQKVWNEFKCESLGEYSDLYLKTDVLLLADVFENFRDVCLSTYDLDPGWYYTAPGLSFDAMLKHTGVELDLLTDYDMVLMVEKGIRGGISQCVKRYSEANNKYMKGFDQNLQSKYIAYVDANNLYGWALSEPLPKSNFRWVNYVDVMTVPDNSSKGYILEVDLEYPLELHDSHSDLPFCPEKKTPPNGKHRKLITTLDQKERYVIHYRALKQALSFGLKLKKVHRVIEFHQSPWMKTYIDINSQKRKLATSDFDKDFYKLMNNAVFGKTMENVRKRIDLELVCNPKRLDKVVSSSLFLDRTIFSENLVAIHKRKNIVKMNKPLYIGQAVLDLSKTLMYQFFYENLKPKYGLDVHLMYMDTDSFILEIISEDFYADLAKDLSSYDTSNYARDHPCYSSYNSKVIGKMKDECGGQVMTHFVGLRSKLYSYRVQGGIEGKRAKGIKKIVVDHSLTFDDYVTCLRDKIQAYRKMTLIRSQKHELHTIEVNKTALCANDDKRFICEDGINTLPWGHYKINRKRSYVEAFPGS